VRVTAGVTAVMITPPYMQSTSFLLPLTALPDLSLAHTQTP
jgi:hypothetical protein